MLVPTPDDRLVDARGRLTFRSDVDLTREELAAGLRDPGAATELVDFRDRLVRRFLARPGA